MHRTKIPVATRMLTYHSGALTDVRRNDEEKDSDFTNGNGLLNALLERSSILVH